MRCIRNFHPRTIKQIDRHRSAVYDKYVNVSFSPNALPVLSLLLYACIYWRPGDADLRLI